MVPKTFRRLFIAGVWLSLWAAMAGPAGAANWKAVTLKQVSLGNYCDGTRRIVLLVDGGGLSFQPVFAVGSSTALDDRMLSIALTALETGFQIVIDYQPSGCASGLYYTPTVAVQAVPAVGKTGREKRPGPPETFPDTPEWGTGPVSLPLCPPGAGPAANLPSSSWYAAAIEEVAFMPYCADGTPLLYLYVSGSGLPSSPLPVYYLNSDQNEQDRAFQMALSAVRKGLLVVLLLQPSASCGSSVYEATGIGVQNVPAP